MMANYKTRVTRLLIGAATVSIMLAGCSPGGQSEKSPLAAEKEPGQSNVERSSGAADEAGGSEREAVAEPVASLPEKDIYLYPGLNDDPRLRIGQKQQTMDWTYATPRQILPVLQAEDYDGDGEEELAAIVDIGSGTGVSLEELHVVEYQGESPPAGQSFADHEFLSEDYLEQLGKLMQIKTTNRNGELFGQLAIGSRRYEVSFKNYQADYGEAKIKDKLGYGSIIYFQAEQHKLTFSAAIGIVIAGNAQPEYFGDVEADVAYASGGKFKLENLRFQPHEASS
ncbi:hypothetical protein [Paenibacillus sacheonensis]|uniref:Uncharacterized protein n=1 Tax=Paenibacillus sacheonensis TaxID=742054 RepID=A0A7X4YR40_9BACL|nr:hypothetical protein [Paenibacillus sacheonensis]MBM7567063.1 hypothetical protein [Paenibacillus sacheonensis]NBC71006.1 hypothetical protein [Paenibacillus sacheonensis]